MRHLVLAVAALACSASASAEIVTFEFTGMVNSIREINNGNVDASRAVVKSAVVPGTIAVGDTFHGRFSYDTATPASYSSDSYASYSSGLGAPGGAAYLVIDKSGATISATGETAVSVANGSADSVSFNPAIQYAPFARFSFHFFDTTGNVLNSAAIPTNLNFNDFWSSSIGISWYNDTFTKNASIEAMVTSFDKVSPVPEPSTYAMLFAGLALVGAAARKRKLNG